MRIAEKAIDPRDFSEIPRMRDFIDRLPESVRLCQEHSEPIVIRESDFMQNPGASPPFGKASFVACCEFALNKFANAVGI